MKLTPEQEAVVALSSGRHLVLAPPGSGKTEMLSRRIIGAVKSGVDPVLYGPTLTSIHDY